MSMFNLKVNKRTIFGKKVKNLRKSGLIPATIYGHNLNPQSIELERKPFEKIFKEAGESTIINLIFQKEKKPIKVLIHDVQYDQLKDEIIHVDFYQIKEEERVSVDVELKFIGEAPVVKEKGGIIIHHLTKIKIEALPKDLIHEIEIDVSNLKDFHDLIRVKDIKISPNIKILHDSEEVIVSISTPKKEEEAVPTPTEEVAAAPVDAETGEKKETSDSATEKIEKKQEEK